MKQANFILPVIAVAILLSASHASNLVDSFQLDRPVYCADPDPSAEYLQVRTIPPLSATEAATTGLQLKQVQVATRHGTRTMSRNRQCWKGFNPQWDCQSGESVTGYVTGKVKDSLPTFLFPKKFDADPLRNRLKNTTCELGQLVPIGHQQQHLSGTVIANAYFKNPDPTKNLFDLKKKLEDGLSLDDWIYFRSTEYQRTRVSGTTLLSSMMTEVYPEVKNPTVTLHTAERSVDLLYPDFGGCYDLEVATKDAYASRDYLERVWKKNEPTHRLTEKMMDIEKYSTDGEAAWKVQDCLGVSLCSRFDLPSGEEWTKENVEVAFAAALEEIEYQFYASNSRYSQIANAPFTYYVKAYAVKQLCGTNSSEKSCVGRFFDNEKEVDDMITHLKTETQIKSIPFVYWSGHETTIGPFLAAFGEEFYKKIAIDYVKKNSKFDGYKSPYPSFASLMAIEFYESGGDFLFRMIYNGQVITQHVPGCTQNKELCSVKTLFKAMAWATRDFAQTPCKMKKKAIPPAPHKSQRYNIRITKHNQLV